MTDTYMEDASTLRWWFDGAIVRARGRWPVSYHYHVGDFVRVHHDASGDPDPRQWVVISVDEPRGRLVVQPACWPGYRAAESLYLDRDGHYRGGGMRVVGPPRSIAATPPPPPAPGPTPATGPGS